MLSNKATIEQLAKKAKKGNKDALLALCQNIANDVLFRASCIMANKMDAEDVMQEVLIRVCTKIKDLKNPKVFKAWLNSIIINEARRYMMNNSKHVALEIEKFVDAEVEESEEYLPQEYTVREENREFVMEAIASLPERQREAVVLHYFDGLNVTETAKAMGIPQQTASMYLKLAREKVKRKSEEINGEETVLPVGILLTQVLQKEAELFGPANEAVIRHALDACLPVINNAVAETAAVSVASTKGPLIAGISVTSAAVVVGAGVIFGPLLSEGENPDPAPEPPAVVAADANAVGTIVFSGGDTDISHLNPTHAEAVTNSDFGRLTVIEWEVTGFDGQSVLYSGKGSYVDDALVSLRDSAEDGEYFLTYYLEDAVGKRYTLVSNFLIRIAS